jgi:hypothetical protein
MRKLLNLIRMTLESIFEARAELNRWATDKDRPIHYYY